MRSSTYNETWWALPSARSTSTTMSYPLQALAERFVPSGATGARFSPGYQSWPTTWPPEIVTAA